MGASASRRAQIRAAQMQLDGILDKVDGLEREAAAKRLEQKWSRTAEAKLQYALSELKAQAAAQRKIIRPRKKAQKKGLLDSILGGLL